jgi:hypothetical protein
VNWRALGAVVALVLFATALRRHADLGDALAAPWFWSLL